MLKGYYSRFLEAVPQRLHFAAHSHHPWLDVTRDAQLAYWDDSARLMDDKWSKIFEEVVPRAQSHVASALGIEHASNICFAPNTHEFVCRLLSCFPDPRKIRVLTTDSEFHSFDRQMRRFEEFGDFQIERVSCAPFETFGERLSLRLRDQWDLVFLSHVFFNSGYALPEVEEVLGSVDSSKTMIVLDCYHSFCALPLQFSSLEDRVFFLGGGYKYAQSGEGVCFLSIPRSCSLRPANTGWFAAFGELESDSSGKRVGFSSDAFRFWGATFDPSGLYRFNAAMNFLSSQFGSLPVAIAKIHGHVRSLQEYFLSQLEKLALPLRQEQMLASLAQPHGHFLTFECENASFIYDRLKALGIVTDFRGNRIRFGFGPYQTKDDVDELLLRWSAGFQTV